MKLEDATKMLTAGMKVQSARVQVAAQNLANADSRAVDPGGEPYRRRTISFREALDRAQGLRLVDVHRYGEDPRPFEQVFDPGHPAANAQGYVLTPNVKPLVELMDLREAQRSYEANLNAAALTRKMVSRTLDLLK